MILDTQYGAVNASLRALPTDSYGQVVTAIEMMCGYAVDDSKYPLIVATAKRLKAQIDSVASSSQDVAIAIYDEARKRLRFVDDAVAAEMNTNIYEIEPKTQVVEVFTRPADVEILSATGQPVDGDCDDFSMYVASLALALADLGLPINDVRFVTIAADHEAPKDFSHVYVRLNVDGTEIPIDASHGPYAGWEAAFMAFDVKEWTLKGRTQSTIIGILLLAGLALIATKKLRIA